MATTLMPAERIEDKVRLAAALKPARVLDYFKDYDRLRAGSITNSQFQRCLSQHFAVTLTSDEYEALCTKYQSKKSNQYVDYCRFAETVDAFSGQPAVQPAQTNWLETSESYKEKVCTILQSCQVYYKYHGISVKFAFQDTEFDRNHVGYVTAAQFRRAFPGPKEITPEQVDMLIEHYSNPATQLINYMQFHGDIVALQELDSFGFQPRRVLEQNLDERSATPSVETILTSIRDAVFKHGIRTTEFFKDHDRLNSGIITENQFICGLLACCGKQAHLSRQETALVADRFRTDDGRVCYRQFCHIMENAFNIPELEKKPTQTVYRPQVGTLTKTQLTLPARDEDCVQELLARLADRVRTRRLLTYPTFKDFDRSHAYTRGMSVAQFKRMLDFVALDISETEMLLICRKFKFPNSDDINYAAFLQEIDAGYVGNAVDTFDEEAVGGADSDPPVRQMPVPQRELRELLGRIRDLTIRKRIRVCEFFQDYDPLRSGSITEAQFTRGLDALGLRPLLPGDAELLCKTYKDPRRHDRSSVLWRRFEEDVERVFTERDLEKQPTKTLAELDTFLLPREGSFEANRKTFGRRAASATVSAAAADEERLQMHVWMELSENVLHTMALQAEKKRVLLKPCFQDFDRHNNGHVTHAQFRQCIHHLGLKFTDDEAHALEIRFGDAGGFNYTAFLEALSPPTKDTHVYEQRLAALNKKRTEVVSQTETDVQAILLKMKDKVNSERIDTLSFLRDYDRLRSQKVTRAIFQRALDLCGFKLSTAEVRALQDRYTDPEDNNMVQYAPLCHDLESIFTTTGLEKTPLTEVRQFQATAAVDMNVLQAEEELTLETVMMRLAEQVRTRRIDLFPLFEDFDRVKNGRVTRSQFRRVLSELDLSKLITELEWLVLWKKFNVQVGGRHDYDYLSFCHTINSLG